MTKKIVSILIVLSFFITSPVGVFAERLIESPTLFTPQTAPHSAKKVVKSTKKATKRILKLGMKGYDVLTLQKFLIKKATGPAATALAKNKASGYFGSLTKDALEEFQKAKNLPIDGVAGSKTLAFYNK